LRIKGSGDPADLRVLCKNTQNNPPDREHGTDGVGRTQSSHGASNNAYDETDWHDLGKERFAGDFSDMLYKHSHASSYDELMLIAAPDVLGNLHKKSSCGTPGTDPCQFARDSDGLGLGMWVAIDHSSSRKEFNEPDRLHCRLRGHRLGHSGLSRSALSAEPQPNQLIWE